MRARPSRSRGVGCTHDTNRSGWWWLLNLIVIVGWIIVIVFQAQCSDLAGVRFDR